MIEQRLNSLALRRLQQEVLDLVDVGALIEEFILKNDTHAFIFEKWRKAWLFHQKECKGLQRVAPKVPKDSVLMFFRLLVRLKLQLKNGKQESEQIFGVTRQYKDLVSHVQELRRDEERCQEFVQLCATLKLFAGDFPLPSNEELLENFGKMVINSFSICDGEMQPIGAGIYLGPSVLDHSCRPNAVVVFSGTSLQVRCVQSINATDKVTISYIDQLDATTVRQRQLEKCYYFTCHCEACIDVETDRTMLSLRCTTPNCTSPVLQEKDGVFLPCVGCGSSEFPYDCAADRLPPVKQCKEAVEKAKYLKAEGCARELLDLCEQCLGGFENTIHPSNVCFVKLIERAFDACIDLGEWNKAVQYGVQLTEPYRRYLPEFHPNVGVHLMKLGKIQLYLDRTEDARESLLQAGAIITVTHGHSHYLYDQLQQLLYQCDVCTSPTNALLDAAVD